MQNKNGKRPTARDQAGAKRRQRLMEWMRTQSRPVPGGVLARHFHVSRQCLVQDVAILRAAGEEILSAPQGYRLPGAQTSAHRAILACRPVLISDRMDGNRGMDTRQFVARLICRKRLNDCDRAMLTIISVPPPPNHSEDLAWAEVVHAAPIALPVMKRGHPETKAVQPMMGNVAGNESG